jgi:hypothetical protein
LRNGAGKKMVARMKQRFPTWWQGLIILISGIVIGFSSCAGFLSGANFSGSSRGNQGLEGLFAIGFFAGIAITFAGFVLFIIGVARGVVSALRAPPPVMTFASAPQGPGVAPGSPAAAPLSIEESPEQKILRHFQIVLVVFMLMPAASVATSVLVLLARPSLAPTLGLIIVSYVLSQAPYGFALARTRRGPDRIGIAIAFAASCTATVEGLLPFAHGSAMFASRVGLFAWPGLFLISHVVVAIFAWRAGKLAPPESGDAALLAGSFAGVVLYMLAVRYAEMAMLPLYMGGMRRH